MKKFQHIALLQIIGLSILLIIVSECLISKISNFQLLEDEHIALASILILCSWWIVYFTSPITGLPTLRIFLRHHSDIRGNDAGELKDPNSVVEKSRSSTTTIALFTAVMSVFLSIILRSQDHQLTDYQSVIKPIIVFLAFSTILLFIFAIDLLDTVSNKFLEKDGLSETDKKILFYRKVGNYWPKGGISYAYFGYSLFTVILIMSLSFFYPMLTGYFLALFVYLGYPIFYGYRMETEDEAKKHGRTEKVAILDDGSALYGILATVFIFVVVSFFILIFP